MTPRARRVPGVIAVLATLAGSACSATDGPNRPRLSVGVTSSFRYVADDLAPLATDVGLDVEFSAAATPVLTAQVRDGAGLDVVVLADETVAGSLAEDGLLRLGGPTLATAVVLAVPAGNPAGVDGLGDLDRSELDVGLCDPDVPCGAYAEAWLDGRPASVDTYEPTSGALAGRLAAGELDAAVTYRSEVVASGGSIVEVPTPSDPAPTATVVIGIVADSSRRAAAERFVELLDDDAAREVIEAGGYAVVG